MKERDNIRDDVKFPATKIGHWPGQSVACCEEHAGQISALGKAIGYAVSFTDAPEGLVCVNCVNEKVFGEVIK